MSLALTSVILVASLQKNIELSDKIDDIQDSLQISIDLLNEQYLVMEEKTKVEVFSDEPLIRELVRDIQIAKKTVLVVAKLLDETVQIETLEDERENEKK